MKCKLVDYLICDNCDICNEDSTNSYLLKKKENQNKAQEIWNHLVKIVSGEANKNENDSRK
ncbi:MAG: hypothetical protein ACYDEI_00180 [Erysipelotrichaceae bacterium]